MGFLQKSRLLSPPLTAFSRVWLRQNRLRHFLQFMDFDGVVDGGANVGEFAFLVRSALPKADLVCVEPHPECAMTLRQEGFSVVEAALWREAGRLSLAQPSQATTSCTVVPGEIPKAAEEHGTWEVDAVRLDELSVRGRRILVKLDLQGAEIEALKGMDKLWERCAGLMLEVSLGPLGNYSMLRALLENKGFIEYSTPNELEVEGQIVEADKIFLRK